MNYPFWLLQPGVLVPIHIEHNHNVNIQVFKNICYNFISTSSERKNEIKSKNIYLPLANEVWGKVIFSVVCVKNSVNRRRGSASVHVGIPPGSRPPWTRHPLEQTPLRSTCWEIRSTSGRYASHWNVILFRIISWSTGLNVSQ